MAAAIVLIPEMLSGPDRESPAQAPAQSRNDAPIKTYTIDLSQSPSAQSTPAVVDNRAPPPEEPVVAQPMDQSSGPQPAAGDQANAEVPEQASAAPQPEPQRALVSAGDAPTSGRWAVQVGSFSKEATAERLAKQLRDQGRSAFVMPVKSGGATLYRVRIGPMKDRASAESTLRDVKSSAPGAAIVSHR